MRDKNIFLLFFILTFTKPVQIFCQNAPVVEEKSMQLKGVVIENETNLPLAYVNVGILNKPVGTVSDLVGNYSLVFKNNNLTDTLQVSIVGYVTQRILLSELFKANNKNINLTKKITFLKELVVTNKKSNAKIIGRQKTGKLLQISLHNKNNVEETIGSEIGMKVKIRKEAVIKDVNWYFSANNFKMIKLRVNVYALKNNLPDTLLCNKEIFVTIENSKTGWQKIDLVPYNITVIGDFVIALQWIEGKQEKKEDPITIIPVGLSLSKDTYVRVASQDKWKKIGFSLSFFVTLLL